MIKQFIAQNVLKSKEEFITINFDPGDWSGRDLQNEIELHTYNYNTELTGTFGTDTLYFDTYSFVVPKSSFTNNILAFDLTITDLEFSKRAYQYESRVTIGTVSGASGAQYEGDDIRFVILYPSIQENINVRLQRTDVEYICNQDVALSTTNTVLPCDEFLNENDTYTFHFYAKSIFSYLQPQGHFTSGNITLENKETLVTIKNTNSGVTISNIVLTKVNGFWNIKLSNTALYNTLVLTAIKHISNSEDTDIYLPILFYDIVDYGSYLEGCERQGYDITFTCGNEELLVPISQADLSSGSSEISVNTTKLMNCTKIAISTRCCMNDPLISQINIILDESRGNIAATSMFEFTTLEDGYILIECTDTIFLQSFISVVNDAMIYGSVMNMTIELM